MEEIRLGIPFVGKSGVQLDQCLRQKAIPRSECYITNVFDYRIGSSDSIFTVDSSESEQSIVRLREELTALPNLNCIVALGADALWALTGKLGITKWRGSIIESTLLPSKKVVPSVHPAWIIRGQWLYRAVLAFDLAKAWEESATPELAYPERNLIVGPSYSQVFEALAAYPDSPETILAFDIELLMRQAVACIGFADGLAPAICIPFAYSDGTPIWSVGEEAEIRQATGRKLTDSSRKVGQNVSFDIIHLAREGIPVRNLWMDTMLAHHCLAVELPHSLPFLTSINTREPYYKDEGRYWHPSMGHDQFWRYNAKDAIVTREVADCLQQELVAAGLEGFFQRTYMRKFAPAVRMEWEGVKTDLAAREAVDAELAASAAALEASIEQSVGFKLNVRSPKQLQDFLYTKRGYKVVYSRGTGKATAGRAALEALSRRHADSVLSEVVSLRAIYDLLGDIVRQPLGDDGRMRCHYSQSGTVTGRWSSSGSVLGTGTNLQNVPREGPARSLFVPDSPEMVFVEADLVQAEVMVVAWLGPVPGLMEVFRRGGDIHLEVARLIAQTVQTLHIDTGGLFMAEPSSIAKDSHERYIAKRSIHASNYGLGPRRFAEIVGVPPAVGEAVRAIYLQQLFPEIRSRFQRGIEDQLRRARTLTTPLGRRRQFFTIWSDDLLREAYAYIPQSTVADLLNEILDRVEQPLLDMGCAVRLQVHDSFIVQAPTSLVPDVIELVRKAADIAIHLPGGDLTIPIAFKVGPSWGSLKSL